MKTTKSNPALMPIEWIGYDPRDHSLLVEVSGGKCYQFADVPEWLYHDFLAAESRPQFFKERIRKHFKARCLNLR